MSSITKIESWADRHHPKWLDLLRICLGLILIVKGASFIGERELIVAMLKDSSVEFISIMIAHYVILAHIAGGVAITVGLITRIAILFQVPILIGAIIFVNLPKGFLAVNSELGFSVLVLFLLVFFLFYGSGQLSFDHYIKTHKEEEE